MNYIKLQLIKLFESLNDNFLVKAIATGWLLIGGVHDYIFLVFTLIMLDVITGIYAAIKQLKKFVSDELKKGLLEKTALYMVLILVAFVMASTLKTIFPYDGWYIPAFVTILIASYEAVSICENILAINTKLTFIKSFIKLTNTFSDKTINNASKAIDNIELKVDEIKQETKNLKEEIKYNSDSIPDDISTKE